MNRHTQARWQNVPSPGIAARQFLRGSVLADGIEVLAAALENGLIKMDLVRRQVQPGPRTVEIKTGGL